MLKSRYFMSSLNRNFSFNKAIFASKTAEKILGYKEKPNEFEITADYIGELKFDQNY